MGLTVNKTCLVKRKGDGQLLALKRIKVKNSNHKTKVWREAKLHAYLTENDVNYDHLIQYFDAWEERIDPEAIKQHDQPYIDSYNVEHKASGIHVPSASRALVQFGNTPSE